MFWADKVAEELKKRNFPLEWVDDMKTPSGKIHVGALRGVVVHDLVYNALKDAGVNTKYTYVFENHDPMDGFPVYLPDSFRQYLGMPLYKIPSPEKGYENFAEYYAKDFQSVFTAIGCHPEIIWATDLYLSGRMNESIRECLDKTDVVRKIYEELYKRKLPTDWYPFQVYCPQCGKVSTTKVTDWDGQEVTFTCRDLDWTAGCGTSGKISPFSDKNGIVGKLPWKVEWAVKWKVIGVTVEGAGKDHMSRGGSHDLATLVCQRVINYPVPYPIPYEWFLIEGRKMSTSKGVGSSASEMLEILPPALVRFLMVKTRIGEQINFDPGESATIPNLFDDYQKAAESYFGKKSDDLARIFELSQINELPAPPQVRFSTLTQWVQMPNMEDEIRKEGLSEWARYARIWVERYAPEKDKFIVAENIPDAVSKLSDSQKKYLHGVAQKLDQNFSAEEFQTKLYEWAKEEGISSQDAFAALYTALLGKDHGPRAGWLILSLDREFVKKRFRDL